MISSARPSLKYSFSLSPLMFSNGRTAIEAFASSEASADRLSSAAFTSSIDANRCAGLLGQAPPHDVPEGVRRDQGRRLVAQDGAHESPPPCRPPNARVPDSIS